MGDDKKDSDVLLDDEEVKKIMGATFSTAALAGLVSRIGDVLPALVPLIIAAKQEQSDQTDKTVWDNVLAWELEREVGIEEAIKTANRAVEARRELFGLTPDLLEEEEDKQTTPAASTTIGEA